jgi:hypothetical protein
MIQVNLSAALSGVALLLSGVCPGAFAEPVFTSRIWQMPDAIAGAVEIVHSDTRTSGGFSALWVSPDCERLITISDYSQSPKPRGLMRSGWFEAKINYDEAGNLAGVTYIRSGQLTGLDGKIVPGAVEAMAWDGKGFLISFDDHGRIFRYVGRSPTGDVFANKPVVAYEGRNLTNGNKGLESLAVLPDVRIFALWDKNSEASQAVAWLMSEHRTQSLTYQAELNPGGATTLADGSLLVLERQFFGIFGTQVRLVHVSEDAVSGSGEVLKGEAVFDIKSLSLDNFEGVSACRKDNRQLVFAISDNNGDWKRALKGSNPQATLLMMIELTN